MRMVGRGTIAVSVALALGGCAALGLGGGDRKPKTPTVGERVAVLTAETGVDVDASIADVAVLLPPAAVNEGWSQPGGSASKALGHLGLGASLGKAWDASIQGSSLQARLGAAPVVAGGRLYAMDTEAKIHAFDATTGARVWTVDFGADAKDNRRSLFGGGVSADGTMLYATNGIGDVAALNAADGSVVWKKRPGGPLRGAPVVAIGNVYVMSQDNQMFALKASDGNLEWQESAALEIAGVFGVAAPAVAQGTVVAGFSSGELNAYRYENGRPVWGDALARTSISTSVASLSDIDASPVIDQGRVFAVGQGGRMVSLELVTGQRLWEINVAGISTPWVAGEWVFVVTDEAKLLCIARATGKVRWMTQLQRWRDQKDRKGPINWIGPVLAGDRLVVANTRGEVAMVSPADGAIQGTMEVGAPVYLSPIVANNTLYILANDGKITAWR